MQTVQLGVQVDHLAVIGRAGLDSGTDFLRFPFVGI
jgi:hypothetical protein